MDMPIDAEYSMSNIIFLRFAISSLQNSFICMRESSPQAIMANSSPPSLPAYPLSSVTSLSAYPVCPNTRSPTLCPNVSFMILKSSTSSMTKITSPSYSRSFFSQRSSNVVWLYNPVNASFSAFRRISISASFSFCIDAILPATNFTFPSGSSILARKTLTHSNLPLL